MCIRDRVHSFPAWYVGNKSIHSSKARNNLARGLKKVSFFKRSSYKAKCKVVRIQTLSLSKTIFDKQRNLISVHYRKSSCRCSVEGKLSWLNSKLHKLSSFTTDISSNLRNSVRVNSVYSRDQSWVQTGVSIISDTCKQSTYSVQTETNNKMRNQGQNTLYLKSIKFTTINE